MAKVIIFTGAGISAESGIATFRDSDGLWENHKVEEVCNFDSLQKNKEKTISFYDARRKELEDKKPNHAHEVIAKLKAKYPTAIALITQNIDDLFEKAGVQDQDIIHLHGFLKHLRCTNEKCSLLFDIGYTAQGNSKNSKCLDCQSELRPNIVFFGENAPQYHFLNKEIENCALLVVIGTSGKVIPLNNLTKKIRYSVLNNLTTSPYIKERRFTKVFFKPATEAIDDISKVIESFLTQN
ncbi:MAG: NAD-dependent deacetylase [Flavobacteria bacterium RIFCSPLOWO2_12_FULL_35_11]|nr:MAG: NAD-dependent deacetylase [Flavobacteria bacterium RIFCSPLOWO2_12_FULL_35_11]